MGETVGAVTLLTRKPFPLLILLWSLYPSKSGQAIPSALCHFKLAKTVCAQFSNGKDAYDYLACNTVDIVLTDIVMPIMTGVTDKLKCPEIDVSNCPKSA
ncbi:MAG: hypothetical protein ACOX1A_04920 [Saccharofermentanales bacterium]